MGCTFHGGHYQLLFPTLAFPLGCESQRSTPHSKLFTCPPVAGQFPKPCSPQSTRFESPPSPLPGPPSVPSPKLPCVGICRETKYSLVNKNLGSMDMTTRDKEVRIKRMSFCLFKYPWLLKKKKSTVKEKAHVYPRGWSRGKTLPASLPQGLFREAVWQRNFQSRGNIYIL